MTADASPPAARPARRKYVPAVGPRLRVLLWIVFVLLAVLAANSVYLASVTGLEYFSGQTYQDYFYQLMFLLHLVLGLLLVVPFVAFGTLHLLATRKRKNRRAVRIGYALFVVGNLVLLTGLLLMRVGILDLNLPAARLAAYWLHVACPLAAVWLYWLHRLAGPPIKWRVGLAYGAVVAVVVLAMVAVQSQDPRTWNVAGPQDQRYFEPSLVRTHDGNFIPSRALMDDQYCLKCHADVHAGWSQSAHRFSSFNNPAYLASVRETREVVLRRDGHPQAVRWCAGCHDPVPFLSGAMEDPAFDDVHDPTSQAGITCSSCHAITHVNSTRGNADFTIEEPLHYPFAYSRNPVLQYINNQLVKAKPAFHKKTFLKPFHKTAEFCSTCHKVHLPKELNQYREFLRGQNHYDNYLLSGVSGHNARAFYYPPQAQENCNNCHMPLRASRDFAARTYPGHSQPSIHDHLFVGANTGIAWLLDQPEALAAHSEFLRDCVRVDLFGIKEGGAIDGRLHAPLRPAMPVLEPGGQYLLESVIRTLRLGHLFTQGTADSNEVWLEVLVTCGDRVLAHSGALDQQRQVDPWAHFVNVFMLDKDGNRIDRRNAQDIFVPLYNHQIPPGAAQVVHYALHVPQDVDGPIRIQARLNYRKFDHQFAEYFTARARPGDLPIRGYEPGQAYNNPLPVVVLAEDAVELPVRGRGETVTNVPSDVPAWQRWNDYGIGLFLEGKAELRQAAEAFEQVHALGRYDGQLNLARVLYREGRLDEAVEAVRRAAEFTDPPAPHWTLSWLSGLLNREQGYLDEAERNLRAVLAEPTAEMRERGFDFRLDIEVINLLGQTLFDRARQLPGEARRAERESLLRAAAEQFATTLEIDSEDVTAHYNLALLYGQLGDRERADEHRRLHERYKPDDNARDRAVALARRKYPAANHAAEALVIYRLEPPAP